ncbi:TonB-dependent siderophore receptor [Pseudomonas sp. JUb96]|uniref:TonB-dependent siderophore receptor n=1 Tax=Pseudomonas sp. JUb96 TaxID=2940539 RepID=UPI00222671E6|nr:TonB-dependent siderophore receptor [Pseudomonas sp. JUb96]MCW2271911.1 outer membrane receptor for ferric coprogen and ferric-rhodotorulic acid [Pseudomonas sp. JUb96]
MFPFWPRTLAVAIALASASPLALAEQTAPAATPAEQTGVAESMILSPLAISATGLGQTTEGSGSYTTGTMQTATKLPLSMRETPQAVTVITRQRMDDQAMTSVNDVVKNTPGLFLSQSSGPGRQTYSARGFDIDNIMYDGLPSSYQGWTVGIQPNLAMFDRVEVIRGATGLVTGSGNPSAAINMVRKRPTAEQQVTLTSAAGSWDDYRGEFDASSPLNESGTLRGRVVGSYRDADTFRDGENSNHGLFYAVTEADLGEDTTLTFGLSRQEDRTNFFWGGLPIGTDGHHLDLPRSTNPGTDWEDKKQDINTVFGEVRHRFANDWQVQASASQSTQKALFSGTYLSRYNGPLERTAWQSRYDETQSAYDLFASGPLQAFGRTHEVVVGASSREYDVTTHNYSPYTLGLPLGAPKPDFVRTTDDHEVTTQNGVYLTTRLSLADPLTLILGGRLDWYDYDNHTGDGDYKVTRNVTRYAGLIYDINDTYSVYASYTDIFTPQTQKDIGGKLLEPIVGENYEIGIKGEYFDGALNASLAVFQVDQLNRASQADDQTGCPEITCYEASGKVRSQGLDLELQGALTEQWQVGAGYTYTRARYIKDQDPAKAHQPFTTDAPEHLFKLSTVYRFQGPLEKLRVGGNVYWQSRLYNDVALTDGSYRIQQGSYAVTDLMAGYEVNKHLDLQLNANNVFDRVYYSAIGSDVTWGSTDTYGNPRNYMLTAKYKF